MDYLKTLNRIQLKQMLDEHMDFALIDILPPEYYEEMHLPGAVNACVYDVTFVAQVEAITPDKNRSIVVYCNGSASKATDVAMQKLAQAGYTAVYVYKGGSVDWRRAGNPVEGTKLDPVFAPQVENRTYEVDVAQSAIEWIGRNITGSHYGTINILSGSIPIRRNVPTGASFVIDMDSIRNLDVQDATLNRVLVEHLKSEDFFEVKKFPTARFEAVLFQPVEGAKPGAVNYQVKGRLTIKEITHEVVFPGPFISLREDLAIAAEAHFDIDRTLWNVNYGSGKFFEKLGRHLVHDRITLQLKVVAK